MKIKFHLLFSIVVLTVSIFAANSNSTAQECYPYGCVKLCNESKDTMIIAVIYKDGGLSCGFSGTGCRIYSKGWYTLKTGECFKPTTGLWFETFYSIYAIDSKGKSYYPSYKEDTNLLKGYSTTGLSGYSGYEICATTNLLNRSVAGDFTDAFKETCPKDYYKAKVNLYTRGAPKTVSTFSLE